MKRYLTLTFTLLASIVLVIGLRTDYQLKGILAWAIVLILLSLGAFFTKYIPNRKSK